MTAEAAAPAAGALCALASPRRGATVAEKSVVTMKFHEYEYEVEILGTSVRVITLDKCHLKWAHYPSHSGRTTSPRSE